MFERFYRGSERASKSGTGLGLSIARELIELMGGTHHAPSRAAAAGSTFTVRMPRRPAAGARTSPGTRATSARLGIVATRAST